MLARAFVSLLGPFAPSAPPAQVRAARRGAMLAVAVAWALSSCAPAAITSNAALVGDASATPGGRSATASLPIDPTTAIADAAFAPSGVRAYDAPGQTSIGAGASSVVEAGMASWYGPGFAGRLTANGEVFDPSQLTAAHKSLPFNSLVRVVNEANGMAVVVRINDRGPFKPGRIIDLSRASAEAIGMIGTGVARVRLELLTLPDGVVRVAAAGTLRGYEVISRLHAVGTLLVLEPRLGGAPVVVRVVSQAVPVESPADVLVAYELYATVGSEATVHLD